MSELNYLVVDIGDVLLLKNDLSIGFDQLLMNELGVSESLAHRINELHYTTMETRYVPEEEFRSRLESELEYAAPPGIYSYFENAYRKQVKVNSELLSFLGEVKDRGIRLAILSNTIAIYENVQSELGINRASGFDLIVLSWRAGVAKPDKRIYAHLLDTLAVEASTVLFIDDKQRHLDGAASMGMDVLRFASTEQVIRVLRKRLDDLGL